MENAWREIVEEFRPLIYPQDNIAYEGIALLNLFLPTKSSSFDPNYVQELISILQWTGIS